MPDAEKILSQHEVDALLSAIDSGGAEARPDSAAVPYDFRRPARLSREPLRAIESLHEAYARSLQAALTALLHTSVEVKLAGVHQVALREFLDTLPRPTALTVLSCEPLEGSFLLEVNPSVAWPMIERVCGSPKIGAWQQDRALSVVEWSALETVFARLVDLLREAWAPIGGPHFRFLRRESDPGRVPLSNANEPAVSVVLEVAIGDQRGCVDLAFPLHTIEGVRERLAASGPAAPRKKEPSPGQESAISQRLAPAELRLEASLPVEELRLEDLRTLRSGDLLVTHHPQGSPVWVSVEGREKFAARLGSLRDHKALKVVGVLRTGPGAFLPPSRAAMSVLRPEPPPAGPPPAGPPALVEQLLRLPLVATVVLAERPMRLRDVLALKVGEVIPFGKRADEPLELRAARRPLARGAAVRVGPRFGLRVTSVRDARERGVAPGP